MIDHLPVVVAQTLQVWDTLHAKDFWARRADLSPRVARDSRMASKRLQHVIDVLARPRRPRREKVGIQSQLLRRPAPALIADELW